MSDWNQWGYFCIGLVAPLVFYVAVTWVNAMNCHDAEAQRAEPCVRSEQLTNEELDEYYRSQRMILRKYGYTCSGGVCVNRDNKYPIPAPGY